jgi:hypothetical protein
LVAVLALIAPGRRSQARELATLIPNLLVLFRIVLATQGLRGLRKEIDRASAGDDQSSDRRACRPRLPSHALLRL